MTIYGPCGHLLPQDDADQLECAIGYSTSLYLVMMRGNRYQIRNWCNYVLQPNGKLRKRLSKFFQKIGHNMTAALCGNNFFLIPVSQGPWYSKHFGYVPDLPRFISSSTLLPLTYTEFWHVDFRHGKHMYNIQNQLCVRRPFPNGLGTKVRNNHR